MKRIFVGLMTIIVLLFAGPLYAQEAGSPADLIARGDAAFERFDNQAALESYQKALEIDPQNYEATWKLARAYVDVGEKLDDKDQRKTYYGRAHQMATKAVEIDPSHAKGHLYLSIALGRVALDAGAKERIKLSKEVKRAVDKALTIDPKDDGAWHVLGRWHRKLSNLSWIEKGFANIFLGGVPKEASMEKAVECFKKAIRFNQAHINHHLELAMTYETAGEKEQAIAGYRMDLELPVSDADDEDHKAEAEKRLKKLE